jgi:NAD(P)-dependent dehydrogenase (short-subunit alcohol dehydrogenase family)
MGWLDGEVAVITGAGSGLGRALVDRFVAEGARIVAVDRADDRVAEVEKAHGGGVVAGVVADVTSAEDNERAVAEGLDRFGQIDVFIGNAGIFDFGASFVDTPIDRLEEGFDELFALNVKGYLLGVKAAVNTLIESGGSVLLTASMSSWHAGVGGVVYTASKHAVVGLVRQLAHELAPKVRVNGVAPGFMRTDIRGPKALGLGDVTPSSLPDLEQIAVATTPLRFLPRPEDYTGHFVQLASRSNAPATTGTVVACDGGLDVRGIGLPAPG